MHREAGKEQVAKVHCDGRGAVHIGPEPCAGLREGVGEALAGERAGVRPRHSFAGRSKVRDGTQAFDQTNDNHRGRPAWLTSCGERGVRAYRQGRTTDDGFVVAIESDRGTNTASGRPLCGGDRAAHPTGYYRAFGYKC